MRSKCDVIESDGDRQPSSQKRIRVLDSLVYAPTKWTFLGQQSKAAQRSKPSYPIPNKPSYLNGLKLRYRKRRKICLCKMPTKTHHQTHLHLPDCRSAFNFSALTVPLSHTECVSFLLHRHGSLMIQASVREAIWARQCTHPSGRSRWSHLMSKFKSEQQKIFKLK